MEEYIKNQDHLEQTLSIPVYINPWILEGDDVELVRQITKGFGIKRDIFEPSDFWGPESYATKYKNFVLYYPLRPDRGGYGSSLFMNLLEKVCIFHQRTEFEKYGGMTRIPRIPVRPDMVIPDKSKQVKDVHTNQIKEWIEQMRKAGMCIFVTHRSDE